MRWLLTFVFVLMAIVAPSVVSAQQRAAPPGYRLVCRNGICGYERIVAAAAYAAPGQAVAYAPTVYGIAPEAASLFRNASYVQTIAPTADPAPLPAVPVANTGTVCNCAVTGVCTCDPALCACPACLTGRVRMGGGTVYATGNSYYTVGAPTVMAYGGGGFVTGYAAAPAVTTYQDGYGNMYVAQNYRGAYARRMRRHVARGIRLGLE